MENASKNLNKHICLLLEQGLEGCVRELTDHPIVECIHCGVKANSLRNVCAAHFDNGPSGEAV